MPYQNQQAHRSSGSLHSGPHTSGPYNNPSYHPPAPVVNRPPQPMNGVPLNYQAQPQMNQGGWLDSNGGRTSGPHSSDLTQHRQTPPIIPQPRNGQPNFRPDQRKYQNQDTTQRPGSNPQAGPLSSGPNEVANVISKLNISQRPPTVEPKAHSRMASTNGNVSSDDDDLEDNSLHEPRQSLTMKWNEVVSVYEGIEGRKKLGEGGYGNVVQVTDANRRLVTI
jgi:hypothetical protein